MLQYRIFLRKSYSAYLYTWWWNFYSCPCSYESYKQNGETAIKSTCPGSDLMSILILLEEDNEIQLKLTKMADRNGNDCNK